jgi:hypothetical protein
VISLVMLLFARGYWSVIQNIPTILALLVYATPSIALAALRRREPGLFPKRRYAAMAHVSFAALAVVFVAAGGELWGMVTLAAFCLVLFGLPVVAPMARWYDARAHVREFGELRTNTGAQLAGILGGYFGLLTIAEAIRRVWPSGVGWGIGGLAIVAVISLTAFRWLVRLSVKYMAPPNPPPLLPKPLTQSAKPDGATGAGS